MIIPSSQAGHRVFRCDVSSSSWGFFRSDTEEAGHMTCGQALNHVGSTFYFSMICAMRKFLLKKPCFPARSQFRWVSSPSLGSFAGAWWLLVSKHAPNMAQFDGMKKAIPFWEWLFIHPISRLRETFYLDPLIVRVLRSCIQKTS